MRLILAVSCLWKLAAESSPLDGMYLSYSEIIFVDECVGVVREEAGTGDVLSGLVWFYAVCAGDVARYGTEVVAVGQSLALDFDYPFESVS